MRWISCLLFTTLLGLVCPEAVPVLAGQPVVDLALSHQLNLGQLSVFIQFIEMVGLVIIAKVTSKELLL